MDRKAEYKSLSLVDKLTAHLDLETDEYIETAILSDGKDSKRAYRGTIRGTIHKRDKGFCFYCSTPVAIEAMEVDHVIPWSKGGRTIETNGVCSCRSCNRHKSAKVW